MSIAFPLHSPYPNCPGCLLNSLHRNPNLDHFRSQGKYYILIIMGILFSRIFQSLFGSKEVRILILGLDNAGKTTILYRLQNDSEENIQTIPTIGFNVEVLQYKNIKFQVWDLGGQTSIRPYWRCYYPNTDAIIFVVDSCDSERLGVAKQELLAMLEVSGCVSVAGRGVEVDVEGV